MSTSTDKPDKPKPDAAAAQVESLTPELLARLANPMIAMPDPAIEAVKIRCRCVEQAVEIQKAHGFRVNVLTIAQEIYDWASDPSKRYVADPAAKPPKAKPQTAAETGEKAVDWSGLNRS